MPVVRYQGHDYECKGESTLLDEMIAHGVTLPHGCRSGGCMSCMMQAVEGTPPRAAQKGVKDTKQAQNYFLACQCRVESDMEIALAAPLIRYQAEVIETSALNESVTRIRLRKPEGFDYYPGQFIHVIRAEDELMRSYSLASVRDEDFLELHIKHVTDGKMSSWLCTDVSTGMILDFQGATGDCFYVPDDLEQTMVLAGTGTGLAPLYGIVRDAINAGHTGDIHLFHASLATAGLYYIDELRAMAAAHPQVHYYPCVLHGDAPKGGLQGAVDAVMVTTVPNFSGMRVYLCGDPAIVKSLREKAFMAGAPMQRIYADAFVFS
ncbi:MAG: FAD-binding oxidoreductase [Mariprofundaceae bacterium]|nr:FAD-binding oxidoreductase [Mariprofundaceae bacterium]